MNWRLYTWVVLGGLLLSLAGCQWGDIGYADDMASRQEQMRQNRSIPTATEMPPGLGEDLPMNQPPPQSVSDNK